MDHQCLNAHSDRCATCKAANATHSHAFQACSSEAAGDNNHSKATDAQIANVEALVATRKRAKDRSRLASRISLFVAFMAVILAWAPLPFAMAGPLALGLMVLAMAIQAVALTFEILVSSRQAGGN